MRVFLSWLSGLLCLLLLVSAAQAAESAPWTSDHTVATLITDSDTAEGVKPLHVALRLRLQPGWHTYWRNPGDAGEPVEVQLSAQGGLQGKTDKIIWPVPERIRDASLMSYAYTGDVVLPLKLDLKPSGQGNETTLHAHATWLVCASACVPEEADFSVEIGKGPWAPSPQFPLFEKAEQAMPVPSPYVATISAEGVLRVAGEGLSGRSVKDAWFMPDEQGMIEEATSQKVVVRDGEVLLDLHRLSGFKQNSGITGVLVLKDLEGREQGLLQKVLPGASAGVMSGGNATGLSSLLLFAFLGGLILNLMPCVFPILAMKTLSIAKLGKAGRRAQTISAGCYALGVVVSFLVIGGGLMGLRIAGDAAGWGFQFQSSIFVTGMGWLLFVMALNLLGVFEFLPVAAVGSVAGHGLWHDVVTGILAVAVATPCTAPFMGIAIAGALASSPLSGLLVFAAMGLGLAAPYVVFALSPRLMALMPRPGIWMQYLRQVLAFPLLGSCVWLLWVVSVQVGSFGVLIFAAGMTLLGFVAWLYGVGQTRAMSNGRSAGVALLYGIVLLGLLLAGVLLSFQGRVGIAATDAALPQGTEPFSEARLKELKQAGRPVFVDMTAAWCITCLVNERVALDVPSTREVFARNKVVILRGDWTNRNAAISAYLAAHGRNGVPLYVYTPPYGEDEILPQVLTPALVQQVVEKAAHQE
ncbi:MAG: cytochrome C biogenesis protein [Acetobacter sp.]|nr:cytochrome C biogenesis protein [Acetobacter sp.]